MSLGNRQRFYARTVNVYMQPIEAGVKQTFDAIYSELPTPKMRAGL
jgi:hypothetical protein